jgi:SAM-dependent methyltransferase
MAEVVWAAGEAYEAYIGRWSRGIAEEFVRWLGAPAGLRWVDVGCGTGALTAAVARLADPAEVVGVDPSEGFLAHARARISDQRVTFRQGGAESLPLPDSQADALVNGLSLNFVPDPALAAAEFARVLKPGGVVAGYVWDYNEGMAMLRYFWDAAAALDPAVADIDEGLRFSLCQPDSLSRLWTDAGLTEVTVRAVEIPTVFADFDDYWTPFLGGQGPAPGYVKSLAEPQRDALRDLLRSRLPATENGSIALTARAWAGRGLAQ